MFALDWKKATLPILSRLQPSTLAKLPGWVSMLLLVAIAYGLAMLTWLVLPQIEQTAFVDHDSAAGLINQTSAAGASDTTLPDIASWHLFGVAGAKAVQPVAPVEVPETNLKLELKGILSSKDTKLARAIVAEPPRSEDTYAIGAALPGGATLVEINTDHIVLQRGGAREKLMLPRESMTTASGAASARVDQGGEATPVDSVNDAAGAGATPQALGATGSLAELRDTLNNDPQSLVGLIGATPEIVEGKITGFKLDNMQNERLLRRFGLRRGDVITAVNDIRLDGVANLPHLLNELKTAQQVKIEYNRRGRPRSVVLNMNE